MFMRLITKKTKILTMHLQKEDLNILDALRLIESTVKKFKEIRADEKAMDDEIKGATDYASQLGVNPFLEFEARHRIRLLPRKIDEHPETTAKIGFYQYYRKEMGLVLDCLIFEYEENLKLCLEKIKPLAETLQPPLKEPNANIVKQLCSLFTN